MSSGAKNIVILNGSPKLSEASVSGALASLAESRLKSEDVHISIINVRKNINSDNAQDFSAIMNADALIFIFPLYFFCLPGVLIRYLQDFYEFFGRHEKEAGGPKVYAIVNCGFPESNINTEALRVIKSFSSHINASYRFGISLGGGGMFLGAQQASFMKKPMAALGAAFNAISNDIAGGGDPLDDVYIEVKFPRFLYFFGGNMGWKQLARKNGLKKKDLYSKPYEITQQN